MEAWRFGFNLEAANKFDPTDADIVAYYLLPRAIGFPNPFAHAVIDADPCSCPPWEFMRLHGHADSDHALFFGPPRDPEHPKKRVHREVAAGKDGVGGVWDGQRSTATRLVLTRCAGPGAPELAVSFKRGNLSYYHGEQKKTTSGWVMHEYQIIDPPHLSGTVLYRVKITDREKKKQGKRQRQQQAGAAQQVVPADPDQPGPSNYHEPDLEDQPVTGDEDGSVMGDAGGFYVGDADNYFYEGYGNGLDQGDGSGAYCFTAGDNGSYANGVVMGETGGYYVDGSNYYLNQDSGYYFDHGDGSGCGAASTSVSTSETTIAMSIPTAATEVEKQRSNAS